jgi:hypothetical protein
MGTSEQRWDELKKLQEHYRDFRDFYADCVTISVTPYPFHASPFGSRLEVNLHEY